MTGKEEVCYSVCTPKWFKTVLNWAFKTAPKPCFRVLFLSDFEPQGGKNREIAFLLPRGKNGSQGWLLWVSLPLSASLSPLVWSFGVSWGSRPSISTIYSNKCRNKVKIPRDASFFIQWKSLSHVWLFVTPWTVPARLLCAWNSPSKYWNGSPFPPPGDLSNPGIKPKSPH